MNYTLNDDQTALVDAVQRLVRTIPAHQTGTRTLYEFPATLQQQIAEGDFFSTILHDSLGPVAAVAMVLEMCAAPSCLEVATSAFVAPHVCPDTTGPFALIVDDPDRPLRFAPVATTVIRIRDEDVAWAALDTNSVEPVDSLFAYPMGRLRKPQSLVWQTAPDVDPSDIRRLWRIGVAAEIVGCLAAGLKSVVEHVSDRRQFGRPIGAFQAVRHRLAECATRIESARWLVYRAAGTATEQDSLMALGFAQDAVTRVSYDLHQFTGAMGLTLEHPLHRWTYRAKLLRSEAGGSASHYSRLADSAWADRQAVSSSSLEVSA